MPTGAVEDRPDYDHGDRPTFEVFGLDDGATATAPLHDEAGRPAARVEVTRHGRRLTASIVSGAVTGGWSVRWVTGPIGPARGVMATAPPGVDTVTLDLPDDDAD